MCFVYLLSLSFLLLWVLRWYGHHFQEVDEEKEADDADEKQSDEAEEKQTDEAEENEGENKEAEGKEEEDEILDDY